MTKKTAPDKGNKQPTEPTAQEKLQAVGLDEICRLTADCVPQRTIAADIGVSWATLMLWLSDESRAEQYARAREAQADKMAEDILSIADDGLNDTYLTENGPVTNHDVIARSRLRVDARKWLASKMAPKKYGEKLAVGGAEDLPPIRQDASSLRGLSDAELVTLKALLAKGKTALEADGA